MDFVKSSEHVDIELQHLILRLVRKTSTSMDLSEFATLICSRGKNAQCYALLYPVQSIHNLMKIFSS
jgi:hypothetical protein